jgi:hypothetical protein
MGPVGRGYDAQIRFDLRAARDPKSLARYEVTVVVAAFDIPLVAPVEAYRI